MEVARFLFTCSTQTVLMIQNMHYIYISLEIYFQQKFITIKIVIVEIGLVVMEKMQD